MGSSVSSPARMVMVCLLIEVDELRNLHVGQAMDLHWTRSGYRPSIADYLEMNRLSKYLYSH